MKESNFLKANFWIKAKNLNANNMYFLVYSPKITLHNVIEIHYVKRTKTKVHGRNKQIYLPNKNLNIGSKKKKTQLSLRD